LIASIGMVVCSVGCGCGGGGGGELPLPHPGQVPHIAQIPSVWIDRDRGSKANSTSRVLVEAPVVRKSHVTGAVHATVITA
jgi:hypothetical protein